MNVKSPNYYKIKYNFFRKILVVAVLLIGIFSFGCGNKQEAARKELTKMNVDYSTSSFIKAVENNDVVVAKLFIEAGMSVNAINGNGETPLIIAAKNSSEELVKFILAQKEVDINAVDKNGQNALFAAVVGKQKSIIDILTEHGADWQKKDAVGMNILHFATIKNNSEVVKLAIKKGVDVNKKTDNQKTALQLAQENNNIQLVELLKENGAKEEVIDLTGSWQGGIRNHYLQFLLKSQGESIVGSHTSYYNGGSRIDKKDNSISGNLIAPKTFRVKIASGYSQNAIVIGKIIVKDKNTIEWIKESYSGKASYIPDSCTLYRK